MNIYMYIKRLNLKYFKFILGHPVHIFTANAKENFEFLMINYKGFIKENLTNLFFSPFLEV